MGNGFLDNTKDVVRDFVFGMQDGLISNLGLVLGVWRGGGSESAVVLAGLASMFAGAFSMSTASYLSAKSQREVYEQEIKSTQELLRQNPRQCLASMQIILKDEGFDQKEIKMMCNHFMKHDRSTFMKNYIQKKLGLSEERFDFPLKNAFTMFLSFLFGSLFPIVPFIVWKNGSAALIAIVITILALFFVGWAKTRYTHLNWFKSGLEIVLIAIGAGIMGYAIGTIFR